MPAVTASMTSDAYPAPPNAAARASEWNLSPRRRKETLLPQIMELAMEGHSSETIATRVGMPARTVRYWLQEVRQEWIAKAAGGAAEMLGLTLARLTSIYREAMEAWRESAMDLDVRLVENVSVDDGSQAQKQKRSVRTHPQRRNSAMLTRATAAAKAAFDLKLRAAALLSQNRVAGSGMAQTEFRQVPATIPPSEPCLLARQFGSPAARNTA